MQFETFQDFYDYVVMHSDEIVNIYKKDGKYITVENNTMTKIHNVEYMRTFQGFEMECIIPDREILALKRGYHSGSRGDYNGDMKIFASIENDGSLGSNGAELITMKHRCCDKKLFYHLGNFLEKMYKRGIYTDDQCGGHIHISGWYRNEAKYVFGAFRAYEPMLIGLFGNGEEGIMRRNGYSSIRPIIAMSGYGRSNINYISDEHFELRFYDGETRASKWLARELFNDAIVHIARSIRKEGIGRYVDVARWLNMYKTITDENRVNISVVFDEYDRFIRLAEMTNYPYTKIIKRGYARNFDEKWFWRNVEKIKEHKEYEIEIVR